MEVESYRNCAKIVISIPQCETCENYIKGDLLHCRCYDWEIKLRETEYKIKPEDKKSAKDEMKFEDKTESEKAAKKKNVVSAYFLESRKWVWQCAMCIAVVLMGCAVYWFYCQPRFHDLTVELGTETISVEDFMTEFADARNAGIVTDLSTVDISVVGSISLTLRSGFKEETVTLTI